MASPTVRRGPINATPAQGRRSTQRERLLAGMLTAANRDGYAGATVSAVIAEAGVSRPTFYEYFADRDDCFLMAQRHAQGRLLAEVRELVQALPPERAMQASIRALIRFAGSAPAMARFLMTQPLAAGTEALDARD